MSHHHGDSSHDALDDAVIDGIIAQAYAYGMQLVDDEVSAFTQFLIRQRFHNILEIGAGSGGLFSLLCTLTAADGMKLTLDAPSRFSTPERSRRLQFYPGHITELVLDPASDQATASVKKRLAHKQLDFVVIGGDRCYATARGYYEVYRQFVRPGGWIMFQGVKDTDFYRRTGNEIPKLWRELRQEQAITFVADVARAARPTWVWQEAKQQAEALGVIPDWGGIGLKQVEAVA